MSSRGFMGTIILILRPDKPNRIEELPDGLTGIINGLARLKADKVSGVKLIAYPQETV